MITSNLVLIKNVYNGQQVTGKFTPADYASLITIIHTLCHIPNDWMGLFNTKII